MKNIAAFAFKLNRLILAAALFPMGYAAAMVKDDTRHVGTAYCSGAEWADDSTLSVLPIPIVAFFMPHANLHEIKADNYLKRCGDAAKLINRNLETGRAACIPAALTRIVTLGIWQWCPVRVSWEADVRN